MATGRFADLLRLSALAHETRFVPSTRAQYHAAVATLWNLLDRNIQRHSEHCHRGRAACPGTPFGYMRPAQLEHYSSFVWGRGALNYCEVGFNGGHGTVAMLLANPELVAHSFELGGYAYVREAQELVRSYFGERFRPYLGNSRALVPQAAGQRASNSTSSNTPALRHACDVLLVDGDHGSEGAYA
jgi:hypothetical protein